MVPSPPGVPGVRPARLKQKRPLERAPWRTRTGESKLSTNFQQNARQSRAFRGIWTQDELRKTACVYSRKGAGIIAEIGD